MPVTEPYDSEHAFALCGAKEYSALYEYLLPYAEAGEPDAQCMMGLIYHIGLYVPMSLAAALDWYQRAAQQGHSIAWNNMGTLYLSGTEGMAPDVEKAKQCYEKSRALGFEHACRLEK